MMSCKLSKVHGRKYGDYKLFDDKFCSKPAKQHTCKCIVPRQDKTNIMRLRPAWIQISLRISTV
jgi:hypothetical protein